MSQIQNDLNDFTKALEKSRKTLAAFSEELGDRLGKVDAEFDSLTNKINALPKCGGSALIQKMLNEKMNIWQEIIKSCVNENKKLTAGRVFQHRFEKSALVIVFGIVKAGKSTLGNFIRGKAFEKAAFDTPYKPGGILDRSGHPVVVEKNGRAHEQASQTKEWFDEASIESTVSAQLYEMPGMVWVDTPGIGAIEKKEDIMPLEELAKQYVSYADVVVFLCNSANPGIQEDVKGFCNLYRQGKKIIGLITRSDTPDTDIVNGNVVKVLLPKDKARRSDQERYVRAAMVERGIDEKDVDVISISTLIANRAIEEQDDQLWEGGNLGTFYRKLAEIIGNDTIMELKRENPRMALNALINDMDGNLAKVAGELEELKKNLDAQYARLAPEGELHAAITDDVINKSIVKIDSLVDGEKRRATSSQDREIKISLSGIENDLNRAILQSLNRHIGRLLLEGYECEELHDKMIVSKFEGRVERRLEKLVYKYQDAEYVERPPEGLLEKFGAIFGKTYECVEVVTKTGETVIDHGFDFAAMRKQLEEHVKAHIPAFVQNELKCVRKDFFGAARERVDELLKELKNLIGQLHSLRY